MIEFKRFMQKKINSLKPVNTFKKRVKMEENSKILTVVLNRFQRVLTR